MKPIIKTNRLGKLISATLAGAALVAGSYAFADITISTTNGIGADTYLSNDSQTGKGPTSTHGLETGFEHRVYAGTRMKFLYVRFDKGTNLINYAGSTITVNFTTANRTRTCTVYGLNDADAGELWDEASICYSNAPGIAWTNGTPLAQFPTIDSARMTSLGTWNFQQNVLGDQTSTPASLNLAPFLEADTDGKVTFLFLTTSDSSQQYFGRTKETTNSLGELEHLEPRLNMPNAVVDPGLSNLTWSAGSGIWDINGAANWNNGVASSVYDEQNTIGNRVRFDDTAAGSSPILIQLDTTVVPRSITNDSTKDFTIYTTAAGAIAGGTGIAKSGSGTLTLSNMFNTFQGAIRVNGGALAFTSSGLGTPSSITLDGGSLRYLGFNADDLSSIPMTFGAGGATIDIAEPGNLVTYVLPIASGSPGGLTKTGPGTLVLALTNTFAGDTVIDEGSLAFGFATSVASQNIIVNSGATLDTSGVGSFALNPNQTLSGNGTNYGYLTVGPSSTLSPGLGAGTFNVAFDLTMSGGTNVFDVSTNSAECDRLVVGGSLNLNSGRVRLQTANTLTNGIYRLIDYTGSLVGAAGSLLIDGFNQPGQFAILDDSTPGQINLLVVTASSDSLTWVGDGSANLWNVVGAANWNNGGGSDVFNHGDSVTFDATGAANGTVNLTQSVIPGAVTVDSTSDYTFADNTFVGGGKISGATGLTKNNSGKLTILTVNNNIGNTVINGGTVQVGDSGIDASIGSGSVQNNGTLIFNMVNGRTVNGITGSGSVQQLGPNTVTVPGNTSYTGTTTVGSGSTLVLGNGGALTLTTSGVTNDGTLVLDTSASQTLATPFTGAGGFTKRGTGALAINAAPGYTGVTSIEGGTTTLGAADVVPSGLRVQSGATVDVNGFNQTLAALTSTVDAGGTIVNNGANVTNTITVDIGVDNDSSMAINNGATGVIALHKKGTGSLLRRGNSTFTGGTIVEAGTIDFRSGAPFGTGGIILSNGTTLSAGGSSVFPNNDVLVAAGASVTLYSGSLGNGMGGNMISGDSSSVMTVDSPAGQGLSWGVNNVKQFQSFDGTVIVTPNGNLRFSGTGLSVNGGDNTTFEVNGYLQTRNGASSGVYLGALNGTGTIGGPQSAGLPGGTPYVIGSKGVDCTFAGTILGDSLSSPPTANSVIKAGAATFTLTGTNLAYAGSTVVSNGILAFVGIDATPTNTTVINATAPGTLDVTGLPNGTLVLGSTTNNQTLAGDGVIQGNILVDTIGGNVVTVAPGNSTGILTVNGTLTLAASSVVNMELNRTNVALNADRLAATTLVANGATLNVVNIGPTLIAGTKFQLFSGPVSGFGAVNLPTSDASGQIAYTWQNDLGSDGSITLLTGVSPVAIPVEPVVNGSNLELSWPATHIGWTLETQTNPITVGLSNNWSAVANSSLTNFVSIPINPANPTVFYRLTLPLP